MTEAGHIVCDFIASKELMNTIIVHLPIIGYECGNVA